MSRPASGSAELPLANSVRRCASVALTGAPWPSTSTPSSISSRLNFWDALCLVSGVSNPPFRARLTLCAALRFARPSTVHCTQRPEAQGGCRTGLGRAACALGFEAPASGPHWSTLVHISKRVARATKCLTHPCDLWHHRPSNRRSRSTETQLPRGAMVMSSVDKTRSLRSVGAVRAAFCVPYGPKA